MLWTSLAVGRPERETPHRAIDQVSAGEEAIALSCQRPARIRNRQTGNQAANAPCPAPAHSAAHRQQMGMAPLHSAWLMMSHWWTADITIDNTFLLGFMSFSLTYSVLVLCCNDGVSHGQTERAARVPALPAPFMCVNSFSSAFGLGFVPSMRLCHCQASLTADSSCGGLHQEAARLAQQVPRPTTFNGPQPGIGGVSRLNPFSASFPCRCCPPRCPPCRLLCPCRRCFQSCCPGAACFCHGRVLLSPQHPWGRAQQLSRPQGARFRRLR
jgi:hypothetical protein